MSLNKLGIGVAKPQASLHVLGAAALQNDGSVTPTLHFRSGPINAFPWEIKANVSDVFDGQLGFRAKGVELMTITPSGNVGIGTTDPRARFHSMGDGLIDSIWTGSEPWSAHHGLAVGSRQDITGGFVQTGFRNDTAGSAYGYIQSFVNSTGPKPLVLQVAGGNVGIGTTDPGTNRLNVQGGTIQLSNLSINSNEINSTAVGLFLNHAGGIGNIIMAGNGGNVGIGTTDPKAKFHVRTGFANSNVYIRHSGIGAQMYGATDAGGYSSLQLDGTPLVLNASGNSNGNVGIGIIDPQDKLHIVGSGIRFGDLPSAGNQARIYAGGTFSGWQTQAGTNAIIIMQSNGNVGIGTTNPGTNRLSVQGGAVQLQNLLFNSNEINSRAAGLFLNHTGAIGNIMMAGNGGNVGIGTIEPKARFHSVGAGLIDSIYSGSSAWSVGNGLIVGSLEYTTGGFVQTGFRNDTAGSAYGYIQSFVNTGVSTGGPKPLVLQVAGGNVGIGTTNPLSKLHTSGTATIGYIPQLTGGLILAGTDGGYGGNTIQSVNASGGADTLRVNPEGGVVQFRSLEVRGNELNSTNGALWLNYTVSGAGTGNVIVGTSTAQYAKLSVWGFTGSPDQTGANKYFSSSTDVLTDGDFPAGTTYSIYSQGYVWSSYGFVASSDRRIKKNISEINDGDALSKLRALNPTTYSYVDKAAKTSDTVIGFIAQEVKEVIPHAVNLRQEIVPDVYSFGTLSADNKTITLDNSKEHGLKAGDLVRIFREYAPEPKDVKVSLVISAIAFEVEEAIVIEGSNRVFVYGKQVDDFHTLDKNAIFTVNVAATQELDRKVTQLEIKNYNLQTENDNLRATVDSLIAELRTKGVIA